MRMELGVKSGDPSENFVKKKSSSGCLIIKKKVFDSNKQKKKRSRSNRSDSESSSGEYSEPVRRKIVSRNDKYSNVSSAVYNDGVFGRNGGIESERKRNKLDVFEFDEYDAIDRNNMRKSYVQRDFGTGSSRKHSYIGSRNREKSLTVKSSVETDDDEAHIPLSYLREKFREPSDQPIRLQGKNGVLKVMVNKRKKLNLPPKSDDHQEAEDRTKDAIKKVKTSSYSGPKQSKNQVLHVRREKKLKSEPKYGNSISTKSVMAGVESETEDSDTSLKLGSTSVQARSSTKGVKNIVNESSSAEKITPIRDVNGKVQHGSGKKPILYVRRQKSVTKLAKSVSTKSEVVKEESETEDSDASHNPRSTSVRARSSRKGMKNKIEGASSAEKITPIRSDKGKLKCGSGTEKQKLREKIKKMLLDAGWSIDYRPRRNRDYLDAVYINPTGTAYWSIVKAHDALKKDINVKPSGESSPFTPLPEEIVNKLTRQTQKKIEREMKKKRRNSAGSKNGKQDVVSESEEGTDGDEHDEKLSSFMNQNGKSIKSRLEEVNYPSGDDSSGRKSRKIGRCTLLVRGSDKGLNSESDGFIPYPGKRSLLSWLIDSGSVQLSEKVKYMNRRRTRAMLEGWITRDGIHCGCCSKILSVSKFEIHAGSKLRQPFQNIYLESGVSLLECQIEAWNKQEESERSGFHSVDIDGDDPNDDTCGLCGDGGDLICCDGCPSTFHQNCLEIQMLPPGDWHCPNCTCKFCGVAGDRVAQEIGTTVGALLTCSVCEKKYHELCSQEVDALPANSNSPLDSFCGCKCRELFDHIQKLLGVKHELEAGLSWSLIHRTDPTSETSHRGFPQRVECNSKLAVALSIIDECFLPITDRRSGINIIHSVLYNCGSNFSRLNYSGFYTAILERGDEIISAASIRMHGTQVAEMPFIATRQIYRRQGMCRQLFRAIESSLGSIKVEKLVIPAIAELMHTWTEVFGFKALDESDKKVMKSMSMLVFPGTDMIQKALLEHEIPEGDIIANSGGEKSTKSTEDQGLITDSEKKSDTHADAESGTVVDENLAAMDSSLQSPDIPKSKVSSEETLSDSSHFVDKLVESRADLKCSSSDTSRDIVERETTPTKENSSEIVDGHQNPVSGSSIHDTDDTTVQFNLDLNHEDTVVDMERDLCVAPEFDSNPVVPHVEINIPYTEGLAEDAYEVNEMVANTETCFDSFHEVSTQNITEKVNGNENHVSDSTSCGTDERVLQLVGPTLVGTDRTVTPVESMIQSSVLEDLNDADVVNCEVACVKPVLDSVDEVSVQNSSKKFLCVLLVASEIGSTTEVALIDENIQSKKGLEGDAREVNERVADTETILDPSREVSPRNCVEEVNGNENHTVSTPSGTKDRVLQLNADLNQPSETEMEAVVASDEKDGVESLNDSLDETFARDSTEKGHDIENPVVGPTLVGTVRIITVVESDVQSSVLEDLTDIAPVESNIESSVLAELNGIAPVESNIQSSVLEDPKDAGVVNSEVSMQNGGETLEENLSHDSVSTVGGSEESKSPLNSDLNDQNALDVKNELHSDVHIVEVKDHVVESSTPIKTDLESEKHLDSDTTM